MADEVKQRSFQIHLSTAIALVIAAGVLIPLAIRTLNRLFEKDVVLGAITTIFQAVWTILLILVVLSATCAAGETWIGANNIWTRQDWRPSKLLRFSALLYVVANLIMIMLAMERVIHPPWVMFEILSIYAPCAEIAWAATVHFRKSSRCHPLESLAYCFLMLVAAFLNFKLWWEACASV